MHADEETAIRHIYMQWHESVVTRDRDRLETLYHPDATFESPLVWVQSATPKTGILRGRAAIATFFAASFQTQDNGLGRWCRTGQFFANGRHLVWEYPRATDGADQVDLVEMMEINEGRIRHHRVYWGWFGVRTLATAFGCAG